MCSTATTSESVGEFEDVDIEGGGAEGSGVDSCIALGEASMLSCFTRVVTGFGEVEGMRQLAGVVRTGRDISLLGGGASIRLSSAPSGACADAEVVSGLREGKEGTIAVLSSSCGTVCSRVADGESPWM